MSRILLAILDFTLALVFTIAAGLTIVYASKTGAMFDEHRARALREGEVSDRGIGAQEIKGNTAVSASLQSPPSQD